MTNIDTRPALAIRATGEIADRLTRLHAPDGWTCADDLALIQGLFRGDRLQVIGTALGKPFGTTQDRFLQLRRAAVGHGPMTLTAQERLLAICESRAAMGGLT